MVLATGRSNGEDARDELGAAVASSPLTLLAPDDRSPDGSLAGVVGGLDPGDLEEGPQRGEVASEVAAQAASSLDRKVRAQLEQPGEARLERRRRGAPPAPRSAPAPWSATVRARPPAP